MPMKPFFKVLFMAVAYLAIFILGACSGAIHPACYAYIGALLPLMTALVYLNTASIIKGFGAATVLNGFIFVLFLIAGEADSAYIIGTIVLTALAEIIRYFCGYDTQTCFPGSNPPGGQRGGCHRGLSRHRHFLCRCFYLKAIRTSVC